MTFDDWAPRFLPGTVGVVTDCCAAPLVGMRASTADGQTLSAIGTNGYVSTWGDHQTGCPAPRARVLPVRPARP